MSAGRTAFLSVVPRVTVDQKSRVIQWSGGRHEGKVVGDDTFSVECAPPKRKFYLKISQNVSVNSHNVNGTKRSSIS